MRTWSTGWLSRSTRHPILPAKALQQAVQIDPTFALAQYQLGHLKSQQGDLAGAEQQFRLVVKAVPGYTKGWISLAATLAMESKLAEAQAAVSRALHTCLRG
jgi:Tfp pilus assembly protein PilF